MEELERKGIPKIPATIAPDLHCSQCPFVKQSAQNTMSHTASPPEHRRTGGEDLDTSTKETSDETAMESDPPLSPDISKKTQIPSQDCQECATPPTIQAPGEKSPLPALIRKSIHQVKRKEEDQLVTEKDSVQTEVQHQKDKSGCDGKMSGSKGNEQEQAYGASYSASDSDKYYDVKSPKGNNEGVSESSPLI